MKKLFSLIKASMTDGMQLFRFGKKNKNGKKSGMVLPVLIVAMIAFSVWSYANIMLDPLLGSGLEFTMLTIFVLITSILTLAEGIYKSGSLLFNCRDDDLLLSLPIKKSTVLFVRMFKLYVFELLYNALFLVPAMVAYAMRVEVSWTFYLASFVAVIFLPVIPIVISCIVGGLITGVSSKFKMKNLVQIIVTTIFLLAVLAAVENIDVIIAKLAENASSINEIITRLYYPAGAYVGMVTDFKVTSLLIFVLVNIAAMGLVTALLGKIYYKINSRAKIVKAKVSKTRYTIKKRGIMRAIITKELKRFIDTPVLVINAGFGLVLFIVACLLISFNFEGISEMLQGYELENPINMAEIIKNFAPAVLFGLICMAALMSSITSSMISLEGRAFNILKTIPVKPYTILMGKILTTVLIMVPFILVGDMIMFMKFDFNLVEILLILLASVILPIVAESIGIILNLKYPKMNAESDAEVVKQSSSAMVATFLGMGMTILSIVGLLKVLELGVPMDLVLVGGIAIYAVILVILIIYLRKIGTKKFLSIEA